MAAVGPEPGRKKTAMGKVKGSSSSKETKKSTPVKESLTAKASKIEGFTSPYVGVSWCKTYQAWTSRIWVMQNGVRVKHYVGSFTSDRDAAIAYDAIASKNGKPVNFPTEPGHKQAVKKRKRLADIPDFEGRRSQYVGVTWDRHAKHWLSYICPKGQPIKYLGYFFDEETAARSYDREAALLGRAVNFPEKGQKKAVKQRDLDSIPDRPIESPYVGVYWCKRRKMFNAQIWHKHISRQERLGYFTEELEAARAYDKKAISLGMPVNFPLHPGMEKAKKRRKAPKKPQIGQCEHTPKPRAKKEKAAAEMSVKVKELKEDREDSELLSSLQLLVAAHHEDNHV